MRDMSNKSAKARMSKATDALEYIKNSIASGKTVYVTAGNRTTKVTPQAYAKWEASGKPLFKISSDGALLMASGSSYVRLTLADEMLARVTAMSRPGAKAKMGKYRAFVYRGSPRSNVLVKATEWMDSATEAENAAKQIAASYRDKPGFNSGDYFADIAQETPEGAKTIKNNVRFSRPGAKARMGKFNSGDTVVVPYGREMVRGKIVRYDEPGMFYVVDIGKYESIKVAKEDVRKASMSRPGAKATMAVAKDYDLAVTDSEYAALIAGDAVSKKIQGDSQYQITTEDRAIRERAKAAMQSAQARWDNWQKMWERATTDAERAAIEARATEAESKMRKYRVRTAKHRASRPGAKAKFATEVGRKGNKAAMITRDGTGTWYAYVVQRGETGIGPFEEMLGTMRSYANEEKAKRAAIKALDTSGFSRPGAKAEMGKRDAIEDVTNALAIAKRKIDAMTRQAQAGELSIVKKEIDYLRGVSDAMTQRIEKFESTGFSRPGAKVTAGRAEDLYRQLSSGSITYANAKQWERLVTEALRLPDYTPPGGDMSLHEIAEDLGGDLMALKTHSGPVPHAKAKAEKATMAAATPHKVTVTDKSGTARTYMVSDRVLRSIEGTKKQAEARGTAPAYDDVIRLGTKMGEVVEASKAKAEKPSDLEREDVKAGLKLMEKADKAVSDKIRTLIAEGKPQDQAVAIALDMKRRGEI